MTKRNGIILLSIFIVFIILMCCILIPSQSGNRDKVTISITEKTAAGETIIVEESTTPAESTTMKESISPDITTILAEPTTTTKSTTMKETISSEETIASDITTILAELATTVKSTTPAESTTIKESGISENNDSAKQNDNVKEHDRAMYSWNHEYIYEENESVLQKAMELTECNILYQELSSNADTNDVSAFLQRRGQHGQTVYYLCGDPSWGIEKNASSMLKQVERVIAYNNAAGNYKFEGIQFDVEPYCLDDFEANADEYMTHYVENCKLAYKAAHEAGLLVEICIPYWWDSSYGYDGHLEDIIANACDSIAVMNYYKKGKEASHIDTEVALCRKYDKKIINITELQAPGSHDLTENNTYYNDGIEAVEDMWNSLDRYFDYKKLGYSYHYLDVIIELLSLN